MDGEEDETSKVPVNEPSSEVKGGESPVAEEVRVVDVQCEPASPKESVVESLGAESFPPPPAEFSGILGGGDVVGGVERESREEPKDGVMEIFENKEVENEVTSKEDGNDLVNEYVEKEKVNEEVPGVEESAAAEMASEKGGYDDVTTLEEMVKDTAPEGGELANVAVGLKEAVVGGADLADVAAASEAEDERVKADMAVVKTETISEKVDLVPAEYERVEADVVVVETEIISEKVDLVLAEDERDEADVVVLETEIISNKVELVTAEETEMVSEEKSSDEISLEKNGGLTDLAANETEMTMSEGGGTGTADKYEIGSDEGGLAADVATGNESREVVLEEVCVTMEEEMETVSDETRVVADVANDEPGVAVEEEGGLNMEEMETVAEETLIVADVANDEPGVAVQEEGGPAMEEETENLPEESCLVADVAVEDETGVLVPEEAGGAVEDETGNLPEENHLVADVAMEEVVPVEGGVARDEETETLPGKNHFAADVAAEAETGVVVLEEGGGAMKETETLPVESQLVADVAPEEIGQEADVAPEETGQEADEAVEMNGGSPSELVKEKEEGEDPEMEEEEAGPSEEGVKAEETDTAEPMEEDEEPEQDQEQEAVRGKRKRGKSIRAAPTRVTPKKKTEEDVCFICFDGGELVLCDRRGCPKAYHPTCVNRDDAFFRSKGRWNCGWHLCSTCGKNAYYMCYTCTFSLCKTCVKGATILCVRGNKGFCETCMRTVKLIEKNEGIMTNNLNFNDKSSWEYLFKDYYTDLKETLSLTLSEIAEAKNPRKGSDSQAHKQELAEEAFEPSNDVGSDSDDSFGNLGSSSSKRKKARKRAKSRPKDSSRRKVATSFEAVSDEGSNEWASKELLEFVMHMRDGDDSVLTQFDVQALLLEYIKRNKLRDPRRKSQIICDSRLEKIFRKPRVGHFEMLKLLESHFLIKEEARVDDVQASVVDTETSQLEADWNSDTPGKSSRDKKRKSRRKGDGKGPQSNLDDYAAIDTHNINLIYLRRNLVEDLIDDAESFNNQAVGAFVRIRIAGNNQKQDLYRLVQVVGTSKAAEPYKVGKKVTDICLEILNLDKNETVSMDIISNQEFTEEECKRLRQSIKCGLINRLTVGDVQEKAIALQAVRVKDWLESEIVRLSHLRDRASETGRRKDLRECVEKLQLLKTSEERHRRLEEIPEIHTDPKMDPSYESEEEEDAEKKRREKFMKARGFGRRGRDPISPRKSGSGLSDAWSGTRSYSNRSPELNRNLSGRGFSAKIEETTGFGDIVNDSWSNQGRDREKPQPNAWEKPKLPAIETGFRTSQSAIAPSEPFSPIVSETQPISIPEPAAAKINESEKIWFYKDPSGKIQGPFSVVQLRKWNATGYFPSDLRIWKQTETQNDSLLLTDVLAGKIQKEKVQVAQNLHSSPKIQVGLESWRPQNEGNSLGLKVVAPPAPVEVPKIHSSDGWISTNLPSPTPSQTPVAAKVQPFESVQSKPEQILAPDIQSVVSNLQSLVQSVASHLPPAETQGWVKPEMTPALGSQPPPSQGHQHWNNDDAAAPANFNAGAGFQSTAPPPPQPQPQPTNHHWQPQVTGSVPNPAQPQNSGWGPPPMAVNQNMGGGGGGGGWGGPQPPPPQQNPNMNWGNPWGPGPPNQGSAPPAVSGWGPPPPPPQVNANQGWQGPPQPGNNSGWNQGGNWDRGHNQDPGYGGKPWSNRQQPPPPAFGGGSSRPPFRGQRVCKYHESGHCKKGAACDYLHS